MQQELIRINQLNEINKKLLKNKGNIHRFISTNKNIWLTNDRILLNPHQIETIELSKSVTGRVSKTINLRQISDLDYSRPNIFNNLFITINNKTNKRLNELIYSIKIEINGELIDLINSSNNIKKNNIENTIKIMATIFKKEYIFSGEQLLIPLIGLFNNTLINFSSNEKVKVVLDFFNDNDVLNQITNSDIKIIGTDYIFHNINNYSAFSTGYSHLLYNNVGIEYDIYTTPEATSIAVGIDTINPINIMYLFGVPIKKINKIKFIINGYDMYFELLGIDDVNKNYKSLVESKTKSSITEPITEPIAEPITKSTTEPIAEPIAESDNDSASSHSTLYDLINETFSENNEVLSFGDPNEENDPNTPVIINFNFDFFKSIDGAIDFCQFDSAKLCIYFNETVDTSNLHIYAIKTNILKQSGISNNWSLVPNCKEFIK